MLDASYRHGGIVIAFVVSATAFPVGMLNHTDRGHERDAPYKDLEMPAWASSGPIVRAHSGARRYQNVVTGSMVLPKNRP